MSLWCGGSCHNSVMLQCVFLCAVRPDGDVHLSTVAAYEQCSQEQYTNRLPQNLWPVSVKSSSNWTLGLPSYGRTQISHLHQQQQLRICHILHSVSHWPVLVYFINNCGRYFINNCGHAPCALLIIYQHPVPTLQCYLLLCYKLQLLSLSRGQTLHDVPFSIWTPWGMVYSKLSWWGLEGT
jgi:hypothetical protein